MPSILASFAVALTTSLLATFLVRGLARRFGVISPPRPDRWHRKPTALLGGIGIFIGFALSWLLFTPSALAGDALLVLCASAMFVLGLVDDFLHLKPYAKLIAQIAAATAFTTFGLRLPWTMNPVIDQGITIFWIVGITNALNLLDNMDGLAAGIAAISGVFLTLFFVQSDQVPAAVLTAAFSGSIVGFLFFNFNPASIFMGDCGSLFLGFSLAALSLISTTYRSRNVLAVLGTPVMLLLIPILDTTLVTIMRKLYRRPVSQGGRDHTSHRLVALGLSERKAVLLLYAIAAAGGGMAFLAHELSTPVAVAIVPGFALVLFIGATFLSGVKVYRPVDDAGEAPGRALVPTLAEFAYKRRIFEVLFDLAAILLSYYGAFLLHYEGRLPALEYKYFIDSIPVTVTVQVGVFLASGMYRGLWGYATIEDTARMMLAVMASVAASVLASFLFLKAPNPSYAVPIVDGLILLFAVVGSRVSFRVIRDFVVTAAEEHGSHTLVYGAGAGGELLVRELRANPQLGLRPIGFLDDDPRKIGKQVVGLPVLGTSAEVDAVLARHRIAALVVSSAKIDAARQKLVATACRSLGIELRSLRVSVYPWT